MILIKCIWILLIIDKNNAEFIQQFRPFTPIDIPQPPPCPLPESRPLDSTLPFAETVILPRNNSEIAFVLPFMDIDIQIERVAHVMQDMTSGDVFILHGNELFQLFLDQQERRISLMGYLEGSIKTMEPKAAEIILWQGNLLLIVALDEYLEIYQLRKDILDSRAKILKVPGRSTEIAPVFHVTQQLTLNGRLQKLFTFYSSENEVMIVASVNFSKLYGKIRTFKWLKTSFESLEELTVPVISVVNIVGASIKYLITGKALRNQRKTILTIYQIDTETQKLQNKQILTVNSNDVKSFTFQKQTLLLACSSKQSICQGFIQMPDGSFNLFKQRSSEELYMEQIVASSRFIMASRQNRLKIFTDHHLDCYGSFTSELMQVSKLLSYHNEASGQDFVLLIYKTPFRLLIRVVETVVGEKERVSRAASGEDVPLVTQHKEIIISIVDQLRSFLPPRREDVFERMANTLFPQSRKIESKKPTTNIFQNFADILKPKQEKEKPKDSIAEIFHRMVDVIEPKSKEQEEKDQISEIIHKMFDVVEPPQAKERTIQDPLTDVFQKISNIMTTKSKQVRSDNPISLKSGKVGKIKISNRHLRSPIQVLDKISQLSAKFLGGQRTKRSDNKGPYNIALELTNHVKVQKLKVKNLLYKGEVLKGFSTNFTTKSYPILTVTAQVKTHSLNATLIELPQNTRALRQFVPDLYDGLTPSIKAKHIKVASINNRSWSEFYDAIYLRNRDPAITGRLVLQSQADIDHLKTSVLNDLVVENLFNLRQPQVINSELVISRFFVHDLKAEKVNGLRFEEDIVFSGREAYVETPVTMHHLSISGDLIVADKKIERLADSPDEMEFKQFYTNKVVINGTLVLNNVRRDNINTTKIQIGDELWQEDEIKSKYLLKDEKQHFNFPILFDNAKVTAPSLKTNYLNDHLTEDHMLTDRVNNSQPLLIVFMKIEVPGDIICRDYKSKISEIKENLIRPGDVVNITGNKRFEAPLAVDDLQTSELNHMPINELIFKPELAGPLKFRDTKIFDKLIIKNSAYVEKSIDAMHLNNLPLEDLLNHDYHMDYVYVPHTLMAYNIVFHKINGIPFDEFFIKLSLHNDRLILHKDLIVEGNAVFAEPLELQYLNALDWSKYVESLALKNDNNSIIEGNVCYYGDLTINEELITKQVNNYNLEDILQNILMKSKPQLITGQYTFDQLKASNLDVLSINGKSTNQFIDLSQNYTEFEGNIMAPNILVKGSLKGLLKSPIHFHNLTQCIKQLSAKSWQNLQVMQNATWHKTTGTVNTDYELLKYLYKNSVISNQDQVITGNVKLRKPWINHMRTRLQFPANIDLDVIEKDALRKNSGELQIITANKNFLKNLQLKQLQAENGVQTIFLNNIDIRLFNNSMYRLSSKQPLEASLKFVQSLNIGHLALQGLINGLNTTSIYQIHHNSSIPSISIDQLFIDNNLKVNEINHMSLEYFLNNRVTLNSPALEVFGFLTFENLVIEKAALLQSINNIAIDNLVFRHSPQLQLITGHKTVKNALELIGPAHVLRLNGKNLMELYRNTLFTNRNYQFDNLIIDKVTFEQGLNVMSNDNIKQRSFDKTDKSVAIDFKTFLQEVHANLNSNSGNILYLDYDFSAMVKWQNIDNISIDNTLTQELTRISCCEKQLLKVAYSKASHEFSLQNITTNRLTVFHNRVAVKAENFCKFKYRKVKSKISITAGKLLKVFGMKRFVESIQIFSPNKQHEEFVIVHALDLPLLKRNEVRVFHIDYRNNSIQDWQGLTQNIGERLRVFQMQSLTALITNGHSEHHRAITIYHFHDGSQKFKLQQIIDGDYDIIEMLELDNRAHNRTQQQLIISCFKCQRVFIYEYSPQVDISYQIFQILTLKMDIEKLFLFTLHDNRYMLIITEGSYYHLYRYAYIRGWLHITYGYFPNLYKAVPLTQFWNNDKNFSDNLPLMILCSLEHCNVINAIVEK